MRIFAVNLHGAGIPLTRRDGKISLGGVRCWRFVQAFDERDALQKAIMSVKCNPHFRERVPASDQEGIHFEAEELFRVDLLDESTSLDSLDELDTALVFYREDHDMEPPFGFDTEETKT